MLGVAEVCVWVDDGCDWSEKGKWPLLNGMRIVLYHAALRC